MVQARGLRARRRASGRLRDGREPFQMLLHDAPTALALCQPDGTVLATNAAFAALECLIGLSGPGVNVVDLVNDLSPQAPQRRQWSLDLDLVRRDPTAVAELQLTLGPGQDLPVPIRVRVTQIGFAGQDYLLAHLEDVTGRRLAEQRLIYLATHDGLTGLANRELVQQRLVTALERATITQLPVAVLYLDLDHFKRVNDDHGHHAGDALLAAVGRRLAAVLRASDTAGRLGGDEFLVVAADVPDDVALGELRRRVETALRDVVEVDDVAIGVQVSIGAVLSRPGEPPATVIRRADAAMYADKRARRRLVARSLSNRVQAQMVREQAAVAQHS